MKLINKLKYAFKNFFHPPHQASYWRLWNLIKSYKKSHNIRGIFLAFKHYWRQL